MEEVHGTKVVNCRNPSTRRRTVNGILPGTHPTQSDEGSNSYRLDGADERRLVEDERYHARPQTRHKRQTGERKLPKGTKPNAILGHLFLSIGGGESGRCVRVVFDPGPVTPSHSGIDAYEPVGEFGRQEKVERNVHKPGGLSLPS